MQQKFKKADLTQQSIDNLDSPHPIKKSTLFHSFHHSTSIIQSFFYHFSIPASWKYATFFLHSMCNVHTEDLVIFLVKFNRQIVFYSTATCFPCYHYIHFFLSLYTHVCDWVNYIQDYLFFSSINWAHMQFIKRS